MSSSNSPCAACKCLRRKCTQECVFAPYFPPDNPQKFTNVHKVFGASNVAKLLNELNAAHREDAVNSLAYEAEQRLRDPVYGCVGHISMLQQRLKQVQIELDSAKKELSAYIGPAALMPMLNNQGFLQHHSNFNPAAAAAAYQMVPYNVQQMMGPPTGVPHGATQLMIRGGDPHQHPNPHPHHQHHQQQQQQFLEAQQLAMAAAAAAREQEMLRTFEHQQQQQNHQQHSELVRFNNGFDDDEVGGPVTATGFNQMVAAAAPVAGQPSLALGNSYETIPYHQIQQHQQQEHSHNQTHMLSHHPHQIQLQPQDLLHQQQQQQHIVAAHHQQQQQQQLAAAQTQATQSQQQQQQQPMRAKSEEGRSI